MNIKSVFRSFCAATALIGPTASYADDTDIYLSTNKATQATPLVMFTLDVRPNVLSAAYCDYDGTGADDCFDKVGEEIYEYLKIADAKYDEFDYVADGVTKFDAFRALHAALYEDLEGVSIGFMATHDEASGGGAYVLRGFREFLAGDTNGAKQELLDKLYSIPIRGDSGGTAGAAAAAANGVVAVAADATCTGTSQTHTFQTKWGLTVSVSDVTGDEGTTATFNINFTGTLPSNKDDQIKWATVNGTANAPADYTALSGSRTLARGTTPDPIPVGVELNLNSEVEPASENFKLQVYYGNSCNVSNNTCVEVTGTICDVSDGGGGPGGEVGVSVGNDVTQEGANAEFDVRLNAPAKGSVTVKYTTKDGSGAAGVAYVAKSGQITFAPGQRAATVAVQTLADADASPDTFSLVISDPVSTETETVTLLNDTGVAEILEAGECFTDQKFKNWTHAYQGSTMYFELFRYLTGGPVYRGHDGDWDYGTDDVTNLDEECWAPGGNGILAWDEGGGDVFDRPTLDPGNGPVETASGKYVSPLTDDQECAAIYALNMAFGVSKSDNTLAADATKSTGQGGLGIANLDSGGNQWPQLIQILGRTDLGDDSVAGWTYPNGAPAGIQKLNTYILELGGPGGQFASYAAAGANVIDASDQNLGEVLKVFRELFRQILSVSTTFVSASVPVDVFNRASVNDNVFIALFTTDPELKPSWTGNLKKLKLFELTQGGFILYDRAEADKSPTQDAPPVSAIAADGRIRYDALTFWTEPAALPAPPIDPPLYDEARFMQSGADGRFVARGGAGQKIPGFIASTSSSSPGNPGLNNGGSNRRLFTEAYGSDNGVTTDDLSEIGTTGLAELSSASAGVLYPDLNAPDPAAEGITPSTAEQLLCWARGLDDANGNGNYCDDELARSWIMADALHSRPLPINYGDRDYVDADNPGSAWSRDNPDIRILMGTNEGFMHMIQNTTSSTGNEVGVENWAFMPRRVMGNLATLKNNTSATAHPYGVDGPITLLTDAGSDNNIRYQDGDRAWVYFGLRRGGDAVYSMDVSNPDSPSLKWVIDSSTPGFDEIAMTFSAPVVGVLQYGTSRKEVVMFGAGYYGGGTGTSGREGYDAYLDNGTDTGPAILSGVDPNDPNSTISLVKGNAVYIVDADTGALIWKVSSSLSVDANGNDLLPTGAVEYTAPGMVHSIAAPVTLADTNGDSVDDRAYVADMGGNIWRIDLPRSKTDRRAAAWQAVKLASLGNGAAGGSSDRRFMERIDFVPSQYPGSQVAFDALLVGSGDRAHPRDTSATNYFYMIKDPNGSTPPNAYDPLNPDAPSFEPITPSDLADANCFLSFSGYTPPSSCASDDAQTQLQTGWKLEMEANGEKVLAPSVTVANEVFFTTYLPEGEPDAEGNPDPCQVGFEGTGRFYAVSLFNGYPVINQNLTDDGNNIIPSSASDRFAQLKSKGIPSEIVPLGPGYFIRPDLQIGQTSGSSRFRTFWYEKGVD